MLCTISKQKNIIIAESYAEYGFELLNKEISAFFHFAVIISTKIILQNSYIVGAIGEVKRHTYTVK